MYIYLRGFHGRLIKHMSKNLSNHSIFLSKHRNLSVKVDRLTGALRIFILQYVRPKYQPSNILFPAAAVEQKAIL
jgi:hypothetical protein